MVGLGYKGLEVISYGLCKCCLIYFHHFMRHDKKALVLQGEEDSCLIICSMLWH